MLFETVQSSSRPFFQAWYISRNTVSAAMPIESRRLPPMEVWQKWRSGKHNGIKEIEHTELFLPHSPLFVIAELHLVLFGKTAKAHYQHGSGSKQVQQKGCVKFHAGVPP